VSGAEDLKHADFRITAMPCDVMTCHELVRPARAARLKNSGEGIRAEMVRMPPIRENAPAGVPIPVNGCAIQCLQKFAQISVIRKLPHGSMKQSGGTNFSISVAPNRLGLCRCVDSRTAFP